MRLLIASSLFLLFLIGCDHPNKTTGPKPSDEATRIHYVKDERTQLCFIDNTVNDGYNGISTSHIYTNVPCTFDVIQLLGK